MRALRFLAAVAAALGALSVAAPVAAAVEAVTLSADAATVPYGAPLELFGQVTPAVAGETVTLLVRAAGSWEPAATALTSEGGAFRLELAAVSPGPYVARAGTAESQPVSVTIRPTLTVALRGAAVIGATLQVSGRLEPAVAGTLRLTVAGVARRLPVSAAGSFSGRLTASRPGRLTLGVRLEPAEGYAPASRTLRPVVATPALRPGSRSPAVVFLERRLAALRYALLGVDTRYGEDTADAVLAFRKLRGLARVRTVDGAFWRALLRAGVPLPAVAEGDHLEVHKSRQVLFEVRRGRTVRVVHVSTGATGNTPLGRFRVYWKQPGYNSLGMYYSLYFLRGFAVHGYDPVPPYPASHGCVRVPIWFAKGLYDRWPLGASVFVFG